MPQFAPYPCPPYVDKQMDECPQEMDDTGAMNCVSQGTCGWEPSLEAFE
jgi:hypothetical protein